MFNGKGSTGVSFEVAFESQCAFTVEKTDAGFELPRTERGSGRDFP